MQTIFDDFSVAIYYYDISSQGTIIIDYEGEVVLDKDEELCFLKSDFPIIISH